MKAWIKDFALNFLVPFVLGCALALLLTSAIGCDQAPDMGSSTSSDGGVQVVQRDQKVPGQPGPITPGGGDMGPLLVACYNQFVGCQQVCYVAYVQWCGWCFNACMQRCLDEFIFCRNGGSF